MSIILPGYIPPTPQPGRSVTPRATINRTASRTLRKAIAGEGALIPDGYGRVRHNARAPTVVAWGSRVLVLCVWQTGPIDAVEKVFIGDEQYTGPANHYLGTNTQTPDPWLSSAIGGWTSHLRGVAYSVLRLERGQNIAQNIYADLRARLVHDPRTGTTGWSQNPALALANFISRTTGRTLDWASVAEAADACDDTVGDKARRRIGLVIERSATVNDWIDTLREYAGVYIVWGDPVQLIPDRPRAVDHIIGPDRIRELNLRRRNLDDAVNRVVVEYTRINGVEWTIQRAATPYPAGQPLSEQVVRLHGIQDHAQAQRQAEERLARLRHGQLEGDPIVDDIGLAIAPGDVLSITHPIGLDSALFRCTGAPIAVEPGYWQVPVAQYSAAHYSNSTAPGPTESVTGLPDPAIVPGMAPPVVVEEVYQRQTGDWSTRLRISWPEADYYYTHQYRVTVMDGAELVWSAETRGTEYVTGAVQELTTYTVSVAVVGIAGITGTPGTANIVAQGKHLPPGNVPQITATQVGADAVQARWQPAIDVDIYRYELRRGPEGVSWEDAVLVDLIDGLQARIEHLALGRHDLLIRALDSVRHYSPDVTRVTVDVLGPAAPASLAAFEVGGEVRLSWPEAEGYIAAYVLRYGPVIGGDWDSAQLLDRVQALRYSTREIPAGTWRIYIRGVDTAGNLSDDIASTDVEVSLDTAAFLAGSITWSSPTVTNMASWGHRPQGRTPVHYVTDTGETAAARWPNAMSTYTEPLATYHAPATTEWLTEPHDLDLEIAGDWRLTGGWHALTGTAEAVLELSNDGVTWDPQPTLSVKASARYARVRITAAGASTLHVQDTKVVLRIDAIAREESGQITTATSGPATVTLDRAYSAAQVITLTAEGATAAYATYDNVSMGSPSTFDVYTFDAAGAQVARTVRWLFRGV